MTTDEDRRVPEGGSPAERRSSLRFAIQGCTISLKGAGPLSWLRPYGRETAQLVNISRGGLQLLTNERLSMDQDIRMLVHLPDHEGPLAVKGSVVWESAGDDSYAFRAGVLFAAQPEDVRTRLTELEQAHSAA